jgi:hypothetical protein
MFSFFPCQVYRHDNPGFARPVIDVSGHITPALREGKKITPDVGLSQMTQLWQCVADQVTSRGLALGSYAWLPARPPATTSRRVTPLPVIWDPGRPWRTGQLPGAPRQGASGSASVSSISWHQVKAALTARCA